MDAVDPDITEAGEGSLRRTPGVIDVDSVRLRWVGHRMIADAAITVDENLDLAAAHKITHEAERQMLHAVPKLSAVTIHVGPQASGAAKRAGTGAQPYS